ncbi:hypothetical protein Tco_0888031 [Tanacetum coccineum]
MPCVTSDVATPKVFACDKYAIDVEPIPPRIRNNREVHLDYLKHLKESVETLAVIHSNSNSHCKTCNKCIISFNHDECVAKFLKSSKKSPIKKIWRVKLVRQTWQPTGKVFTNVGYQWKPTGRTFTLEEKCPLTRNTRPKVVPVTLWKPMGRIILLGGQFPLVRPMLL